MTLVIKKSATKYKKVRNVAFKAPINDHLRQFKFCSCKRTRKLLLEHLSGIRKHPEDLGAELGTTEGMMGRDEYTTGSHSRRTDVYVFVFLFETGLNI